MMAELPPNWAFKIYSKLWKEFGGEEFSNKEARSIVNNPNLTQAISRLKNDGWLKIRLNPKDSRKSLYRLEDPSDVIMAVLEEKSYED